MVNPNKHRNKTTEEFKLVSINELEKLENAILNYLIINPDAVLKELEIMKRRYRKTIKKMVSDKGAFISSDGCSKIMNHIFKVDFTIETIKLYYYAITIPSKKLEEVKDSLEETFKLLMKIKRLQNRSLDNANYFGLGGAVFTDCFNNGGKLSEYTSKEQEQLLRLDIKYKFDNPNFKEKSSISL